MSEIKTPFAWLECLVSQGQFHQEYAIGVVGHDVEGRIKEIETEYGRIDVGGPVVDYIPWLITTLRAKAADVERLGKEVQHRTDTAMFAIKDVEKLTAEVADLRGQVEGMKTELLNSNAECGKLLNEIEGMKGASHDD